MRTKITAAVLAAALLVTTACSSNTLDDEVVVATTADPGAAAEDFAKTSASTDIKPVRYQYTTSTGTRDEKQNWADLFLPDGKHADGSVPLVVLIHGGAWKSEIGADVFVTFARRLAERGLAVYNLEYRRVDGGGGGWPTTFADVADAIDYIPEVKAANPMIDIDDVVVAGHSAGGQLAMWAGTRHNLENDEVGSKPEVVPVRVVSISGPLDMRVAVKKGDQNIVDVLGGTPNQIPQRYALVDPIQNIDKDISTIAMNGDKDTIVPPVLGRNYVAAAKKAGADSRFVLVRDATHTSLVDVKSPHFMVVLETINRAAQTASQT